jgi:hypothetical protein
VEHVARAHRRRATRIERRSSLDFPPSAAACRTAARGHIRAKRDVAAAQDDDEHRIKEVRQLVLHAHTRL